MFGKVFLLALLGATCATLFENSLKKKLSSLRNGVEHFAMNLKSSQLETESSNFLEKVENSLLLHGAPAGIFRSHQLLSMLGLQGLSKQDTGASGRPVKVKNYRIANCSASAAAKAQFIIKQLVISPDPLVMPGDLTVQFDINLLTNINALQIALDLNIKQGQQYIHIPCIGEFGSCTYNVCEMLEDVTNCPQELVDHKIPCQCPFNKNSYVEPGITATIDAEVFVPSDYNVTATMTSNGNFIGCYTATFTISD